MALRVRPFNEKELKETHQTENLITFVPGQPQQISIDQDRRHFTFDYVYPSHKSQADVYQSCIQPLFDQFVNGLVFSRVFFMHQTDYCIYSFFSLCIMIGIMQLYWPMGNRSKYY